MRKASEGMQNLQKNRYIAYGAVALCAQLWLISSSYAQLSARSFQTHTHVVIPVDPGVQYTVERVGSEKKTTGIKLKLLNASKLAENEGQDWKVFSDSRTSKVKMFSGKDGIIYYFELSPQAQQAGIDFFDYRDKSSTQIQIDYWLKTQVATKPNGNIEKSGHKSVKTHANVKATKWTHPEKAHSVEKNEVGCGFVLDSEKDGFAFYNVYHRPYPFRKYFDLEAPDQKYEYPLVKIGKNEDFGPKSKEVAHYRLTMKLYKESKLGLALRSLDFFEKQYPRSEFIPELDFMRANVFLKLATSLKAEAYHDQAFEALRSVVLKDPKSKRAEWSLQFLVQENLDQDPPVKALEYALRGIPSEAAEVKESKDKLTQSAGDVAEDEKVSVYRLAAAESLFRLGEFDRAQKMYESIIEMKNKHSADAAFKIGELFFARKFWERGILAFEKALKEFPEEAKKSPTLWLNLAESYFRLRQYNESEKLYSKFLEYFSGDENAWAAAFRLAEFQQMKLKKVDEASAIHRAYENVINRYPYSPGAILAELRLSACHRDVNADRSASLFDDFFKTRDLRAIKESPLMVVEQVEFWMDFSETRFRASGSKFLETLKYADKYRLRLSQMPLGQQYKEFYNAAVLNWMESLANENKADQVMKVYKDNQDLILNEKTFSLAFSLAKAAFTRADYKFTHEQLSVAESKLTEASEVQKEAFYYLKARYLEVADEKNVEISELLKKIPDHSRWAIPALKELSKNAQRNAAWDDVLLYDAKLLSPTFADRLDTEEKMRIHMRKIEILSKKKNFHEAVKNADYFALQFGAFTQHDELLEQVRELRAQALYEAGRYAEAAASLKEILKADTIHPRQQEFEFELAKSLLKLGQNKEAIEAFRKLATSEAPQPKTASKDEPKTDSTQASSDFWKKSAQAELEQLQWENNFKRQ